MYACIIIKIILIIIIITFFYLQVAESPGTLRLKANLSMEEVEYPEQSKSDGSI